MDIASRHNFTYSLVDDLNGKDLDTVHRASKLSMFSGVLLILAGAFACIYFFYSTIVVTYYIGALLLIGCFFFGASAFFARKWTTALFDVLVAALYLVASIVTFRQPLQAAGVLTLVLSIMYIFQGIMRIFASIAIARVSRGWMFLNGLVTLLVGIMVFAQWPSSALWLLGILIGIDMLFGGLTLLLGGLEIFRLTKSSDTFTRGRPAAV